MLSTRTSKIKYDVWKLTKQQVVSLKSTILRNDGSPWPFEATSSRSWIGAPEGEQANTRGKGFNMGFNMAVRLPWTSKIFQTCQKYRKKHQRVIYIYIYILCRQCWSYGCHIDYSIIRYILHVSVWFWAVLAIFSMVRHFWAGRRTELLLPWLEAAFAQPSARAKAGRQPAAVLPFSQRMVSHCQHFFLGDMTWH